MLQLKTLASSTKSDDRGQAMIAVIGLLAVTSVITLTITGATVQALGFTSMTRAGVEAQASADAGVEAMRAALSSDSCPGSGTLEWDYGDVDPALTGAEASQAFFSATVASRPDPSATWVAGCPTGSAAEVRIQSVGYASDGGVNGSIGRDSAGVEAIHEWSTTATVEASGAAVFSYGAPTISNSIDLLSFNGSSANILVREGNILCSNSAYVEGDIVAANGNIQLDNTCSATGNVWASGTVSMTGNNDVGGDVIAVSSGTSTITHQASIGGAVRVGGTINTWGGNRCPGTNWDPAGNACAVGLNTGANPVLYQQADLPMPVVPEWVDVDYVAQDWVNQGWQVVEYDGPCTIDNRTKRDDEVKAFSEYTNPTVIDARECSTFLISKSANLTMTLKDHLTFILPQNVKLENFTVRSDSIAARHIRFITPDTVPNQRPTTTGCGVFDMNNGNALTSPVSMLIYTPCTLSVNNRMDSTGQLYTGRGQFNNNSELTYIPIGIPGFDLGGGTGGGGGGGSSTAGSLGELRDYRDISVTG